MDLISPYPASGSERDRWILERRPARNEVDPYVPYAFLVEEECSDAGEGVAVATVFLTNRECPWRCVMCDLWQNTLTESVPAGAIPEQIRYALRQLPAAKQLKLYNSGSFFDPRAIPTEDFPAIAELSSGFERVVVESHPALVGESCLRFRDLVRGQLEVAMGLETVHPEALERMNKRVTLEQFRSASERLRDSAIDLRVFVLLQPPFVGESAALFWAERSVAFAFDCGATAVTLIPTRAGNGAVEAIARVGQFTPPRLSLVEEAFEYGLRLRQKRVFVDLWEIARVASCPSCRAERLERLRRMNLLQTVLAPVGCALCGGRG